MNFFMTLLLALGLAFDAFAVSISCGMASRAQRLSGALMVGGFFGIFQLAMPLVGWAVGSVFEPIMAGVDHWVAFILLGAIGAHMLIESAKPEHERRYFNFLDLRVLLLLSVATSIDALAAGFSFALLKVDAVRAVTVIGVVTFLLSFAGYYIGDRLGSFFQNKVRILGGLILIGIGVRILIAHLR